MLLTWKKHFYSNMEIQGYTTCSRRFHKRKSSSPFLDKSDRICRIFRKRRWCQKIFCTKILKICTNFQKTPRGLYANLGKWYCYDQHQSYLSTFTPATSPILFRTDKDTLWGIPVLRRQIPTNGIKVDRNILSVFSYISSRLAVLLPMN